MIITIMIILNYSNNNHSKIDYDNLSNNDYNDVNDDNSHDNYKKYSENNIICISYICFSYDDTNNDNSHINNDMNDNIDDNGIYLTDNNNL